MLYYEGPCCWVMLCRNMKINPSLIETSGKVIIITISSPHQHVYESSFLYSNEGQILGKERQSSAHPQISTISCNLAGRWFLFSKGNHPKFGTHFHVEGVQFLFLSSAFHWLLQHMEVCPNSWFSDEHMFEEIANAKRISKNKIVPPQWPYCNTTT